MKKIIAITLVTVAMFSCRDESQPIYPALEHHHSLLGSWLYVEYGGSPGAGYHVVQVSADPAQIVTFQRDGRMTGSVGDLSGYGYYRVFEDTQTSDPILALYRNDPGTPGDESGSDRSYTIVWEEKKLKLYYRYCIEGCHLGFQKISNLEEPGED